MKIRGEGPIPSRIMIVGEFPSERDRTPFDGSSGMELNRMLHEAGIMRSECYVTYACKERPPMGMLSHWIALKKKDITQHHTLLLDKYCTYHIHEGHAELLVEIEMVQPNLIIAMGNLALWALTGNWGILKWRGSLLQYKGIKVIPTLTPSAVIREWPQRAVVLSDLRRAKRHMTSRTYDNRPDWRFLVRPTFIQAFNTINALISDANVFADPVWLDFDIETRNGHIDCIGLSWSRFDAICIPLMARGKPEGYWSAGEEAHLCFTLYQLLTHKNVRVRWQNGLYDAQYVHRHWHFIPNGDQDTMITQHSVFCALPKGLAFIASMYADWYVYWKDEGKIASDVPEEQRWTYNLQDCVYTREAGEVLLEVAKSMHLAEVDKHQQKLFYPVLRAMILGVRIFPERKSQMAMDIQEELSHREAFLHNILGHSINPSSPKQMQTLFYEDLKQPVIYKRTVVGGMTKMSPTCDDEALSKLAAKEPLIKPICNAIADIRTLNKFLGDFVMMPLDDDGRMRCSFNIAGDAGGKSAPYSYRLSSSKNPFGSGGNLQTIPSEKSKSSGKAAARGSMDFTLPNIRSMYGPDPGFTFFDMDLDRADLQVVVREADEPEWIAAMTQGVDMHLLNACILAKRSPPPLDELVESHPKYAEHRGPLKHAREFAKVFCHACVTAGHEVLTPFGWVPVESVDSASKIAVWDLQTRAITFEVPQQWNRDFTEPGETLVQFEGQAFSQEVTADHRMPYATDDNGFRVTTALQLPSTARIPTTGFYSGPRTAAEYFMRLLAALQAAGSFDYKYRTCWHFKKERKIERLLKLIAQAGLTPTVARGDTTRIAIYWRPEDWMKVPGAWMLELDGQALDWWLDELKFWDGHQGPTGAVHISSSNPVAAEWINTIAQLRGNGSRCYVHTEANGNRKANWHISLNNRTVARMSSMQITHEAVQDAVPVYCPQTTTGFFMVRRKGKISVTGNSNYGGGAKTVAAHTGRTVHEIDVAQKYWFGAHPGIRKWHERTFEQIHRHRFIENRWGYRWYIFDRLEALLPEALAWVPQSTVGILINRIWTSFYENISEVQVLLQVHDSLAGQFPTHRAATILPLMEKHSRIEIPYDPPLIIPTGVKTSTTSWGDCL